MVNSFDKQLTMKHILFINIKQFEKFILEGKQWANIIYIIGIFFVNNVVGNSFILLFFYLLLLD